MFWTKISLANMEKQGTIITFPSDASPSDDMLGTKTSLANIEEQVTNITFPSDASPSDDMLGTKTSLANMEEQVTNITFPSDASPSDDTGGKIVEKETTEEFKGFEFHGQDHVPVRCPPIEDDLSSATTLPKAGGKIVEKETTEEFKGFEFHGQDHVPVRCPPMEDGLSSATTLPKEEQISSPYCPQPEGPEKSYQASQALWFLVAGLFGQLNFKLIYSFVGALCNCRYVLQVLLIYMVVVGNVSGYDNFKTVNVTQVESYTHTNFVDLSHMGFEGFEANACAFSVEVIGIDVSDNFLSHLPRHCFIKNTELHDLDLSRNRFYSVPPAIKSIQNLQHLNMRNNPISYLSKDDFEGMDQITVIRFDQCHIESIHSQALNDLKSLKTGDFSENKLTVIPCIDLTVLRNLEHMNFSYNLLESLNIRCFDVPQGVSNISVDDDKMKVQMDGLDVEFAISGNSGTLKCEKIWTETQNANVSVACNLSCQFENGTTGRIDCENSSVALQGLSPNPPPHNGAVVGLAVCCVILAVIVFALAAVVWKLTTMLRKRSMDQDPTP